MLQTLIVVGAILTALLSLGQSSAQGPLPTQPLTGIEM